VIVLDTNVLVYAVGADHRLRDPCRRIVGAIRDGAIDASTTVEVIQEFVHVRARRVGRRRAVRDGGDFTNLLTPLLVADADDLARGLALFERHEGLDCFDAVLAAATLGRETEGLATADAGFDGIRGLRRFDPAGPELATMLASRR